MIEKSAGISCHFFLQSSFSAKIGFVDIFQIFPDEKDTNCDQTFNLKASVVLSPRKYRATLVMWWSQKSNKTENTLSRFMASSITRGCSGQNMCHSETRWRCQGKRISSMEPGKVGWGTRLGKVKLIFWNPGNQNSVYRWVPASKDVC